MPRKTKKTKNKTASLTRAVKTKMIKTVRKVTPKKRVVKTKRVQKTKKKVTPRKKSVKKTRKPRTKKIKKTAIKKTARFYSRKKNTTKIIFKRIVEVKEEKAILLSAPAPKKTVNTKKVNIEKAPTPPSNIIKKNTRISPYIIDLKQTQVKKPQSLNKRQTSHAQKISNELLSKIKKNKQFYKKFKPRFPKNPQFSILRKTSGIMPRKKIKLDFSLPRISTPKINLPKINLPKLNINFPKILPQDINLGTFSWPLAWKKQIIYFVVISLIFVSPFFAYDYYQQLQGKKSFVFAKTYQALTHLTLSKKAISANDFAYTEFELQQANDNFAQANHELENLNILVQSVISLIPNINKKYSTAKNLTQIGQDLSNAASIIAKTLNEIKFDKSPENLNLTNKLLAIKNNLNLIIPEINSVNKNLQGVYIDEIPLEYQEIFQKLQITFPLLEKNLKNFVNTSDVILEILGHERRQRYLVVFQNTHEIRPTGGFMGSYAIVDIDQGNISKIKIPSGGPYDLHAGLEVTVEPPKPILYANHRWEFQDSNWFADLPTSAEKMLWFFEKSGGPTVDGIFLINAPFVAKLLKITGPIELKQYQKTITSENFFTEIQQTVENSEEKPKQIIADLTPILINRLLSCEPKQFIEILDLMLNSLNEKEIQLYFNDYTLEKLILDYNWGGQMKETSNDYLYVVSTNIGGEKSDARISQTGNLDVDVQTDGSIINTFTLTRSHSGNINEEFYGVPNIDYLRIYVPKDSELISATGFTPLADEHFTLLNPEIYQKDHDIALLEITKKTDQESKTDIYSENNKTVFANWLVTEPGKSQTIELKYKLPFKIDLTRRETKIDFYNIFNNELPNNQNLEKYSLLWQKQSGRKDFNININLNLPNFLNHQMIYPNNLIQENNNFTLSKELKTDEFIAIIFNVR